jgi:hypothetical protein
MAILTLTNIILLFTQTLHACDLYKLDFASITHKEQQFEYIKAWQKEV